MNPSSDRSGLIELKQWHGIRGAVRTAVAGSIAVALGVLAVAAPFVLDAEAPSASVKNAMSASLPASAALAGATAVGSEPAQPAWMRRDPDQPEQYTADEEQQAPTF